MQCEECACSSLHPNSACRVNQRQHGDEWHRLEQEEEGKVHQVVSECYRVLHECLPWSTSQLRGPRSAQDHDIKKPPRRVGFTLRGRLPRGPCAGALTTQDVRRPPPPRAS